MGTSSHNGIETAGADGRRIEVRGGIRAGGARLPSWATFVLGLLPQLSRYTLVSAVALGIDMGLFLVLARGAGVKPAIAGVAGYCAGLVLHFILSTRFVFDARASQKSPSRLFGEFAATGLVGVAITWAVIAAATDVAHLPDIAAKAAAVATSFVAVFLLRRTLVFVAPSAAA